jgi:dTDP-4-amino-4,6-dideoxygalactose transaminase
MDRLYAIAAKHKLRVIEDAAQAFGSTWKGQRIGAFGDFASFSFQANKNLTTGEGGCLVMNTLEEAKLAEKYRLQGVTRSGVDGIDVDVLGGKYNMTDITAAIGLGQLANIDHINAHRRALAAHYFSCFGAQFETQTGAQLPQQAFETSNWHLFQIILPDRGPGTRATFMTRLQKEHNVGTGYHYAPIHLFTLYRERGFSEGMFPVSEKIGRLTVTLPMFYAMTLQDVERAVAAVKAVLAS